MNELTFQKDDRMAEPMTLPEAMAAGFDLMEKAESRDRATKVAMRNKMRRVFETVRANTPYGDNKDYLGSIECEAWCQELDEMATRHAAEKLAVHNRMTQRSKQLGIDGLIPVPKSGGR